MKFSVNIDSYKKKLITLIEELNQTLEKGKLDKDFEEKLLELEKQEDLILGELLPYYRQFAPETYQTKIEEVPVKTYGTYKLNTYLKSYLCIEKNIFLIASADQKLYLMRVSEDYKKVELSQPIKNFDKLIILMYPLSKRKILLFAVTGDIFVLKSNDFAAAFENIKNLKTCFKQISSAPKLV